VLEWTVEMSIPEAGQLVAQRYRLEQQLGAGGMGEVWSAREEATGGLVALKFLLESDDDPGSRRRFMREARAASSVVHAHVVRIHDVLMVDDDPVIVMELLEGETLAAKLRRDKKLTIEETAAVLRPVVSAVGTAHAQGIIHRDLKPDNIFLARNAGGGLTVKVVDFGIAKLTAVDGDGEKTGGLTTTGTMLGTPYYMSPEQAFAEKDIDHRSDVWSLGIILYRCLSGTLPTRADNVGQILKIILSDRIPLLSQAAPGTPDDVVALVRSMLTLDREERPLDLRVVDEVLRRYSAVEVPAFDAAVAPSRGSGKVAPPSDRHAIADAMEVETRRTGSRRDRGRPPASGTTEALSESVGAQVSDPRIPVARQHSPLLPRLAVAAAALLVAGGGLVVATRASVRPAAATAARGEPATAAAPVTPPTPETTPTPAATQAGPPAGSVSPTDPKGATSNGADAGARASGASPARPTSTSPRAGTRLPAPRGATAPNPASPAVAAPGAAPAPASPDSPGKPVFVEKPPF